MTGAENNAVMVARVRRIPAVRVVGVGGAGLQAVSHMMQSGLTGVTYAAAHSDERLLATCQLEQKVLFGASVTRGLGAGGDPDIGRAAAEADLEILRELAVNQDLVIIVAGLGGGTGSGAAPVVARVARELGSLVVGVVTLPFDFEGQRRHQQAQLALRQLKCAADAVICLPNQKVAGLLDQSTPLLEAFRIANDHLAEGVRGLWRLVTQEGLINVDFADLCRVVRGRKAESSFATASASGENRGREVTQKLFSSPF
ncbi:MAG: cell division FtsZ family protein, partial [Verrucomicrobiae bacterium]|nr:cell division FtsZ family protein [Verrucomicrobiae bacterium]